MTRLPVAFSLVFLVCSTVFAQSDSQALAYAAQSIANLTGGTPISDLTFAGTGTWIAGSDTENGMVTLKALGTSESRMDLGLSGGTRTEIRDASTGSPLGQWITQDGSSGLFRYQNCFTDAVWFFPALGSLSAGPTVVLSYIGPENRNGEVVQHIQSYLSQTVQLPGPTPTLAQLSTMDFYLDAATLLPSAVVFNAHPDNDPGTNIPVEIDFSNYQAISGIAVPLHIQKYLQGSLVTDLVISNAVFNTGLPLSTFAISQ